MKILTSVDRRCKIIYATLFSLSIIVCCYSQPTAQEACETAVTEAQNLYDVGRTAEIIILLDKCLPDGITQEGERIQAYKLLSLAYIAEDHLTGARLAIDNMLDLNANLEPDYATDPSKYIELLKEAKQSRVKKKGGKTKVFLIGGGIILAGTVAFIVGTSGGSGGEQPRLPDPPAFPPDGQ
jgi:hypothetical protein